MGDKIEAPRIDGFAMAAIERLRRAILAATDAWMLDGNAGTRRPAGARTCEAMRALMLLGRQVPVYPATHQHYKGGVYSALGVARHSESEEELVIYMASDGQLWARPRAMFEGTLEDGRRRFTPIED